MDQLWAPWRMQYIQNIDAAPHEGCVFCHVITQSDDRTNLILFRGTANYVIMNRFPYNNGHLMIIPYRHTSDFSSIDASTAAELWSLLNESKSILEKALKPDGFNIGMNLGRVAGAGIDQHIHMHIVPRWNGDTNFMPAIGQTKVLSQSLDDSWDQLSAYFSRLTGSSLA